MKQADLSQHAASVAADGGSAGEIARAKALLDSGAITQVEFEQLKSRALAYPRPFDIWPARRAAGAELGAGQGARVRELLAVAESFLCGPNALRLLGGRAGDVEARYSTPALRELERRLIDYAVSLQGAGRGLASTEETERALLARPFLSGEQCEMVRRLTHDDNGVAAVVGRAGTGKTTGLAAACEAWRQSGVPVRGCSLGRHERRGGAPRAPTARSRHRIDRRRGGPARHPRPRPAPRAGEGRGGQALLAGDTRQLPSIRAGGALGALATRLDPIELRLTAANARRGNARPSSCSATGTENALCSSMNAKVVSERQSRRRDRPSPDRHWHAFGDPDGSVMIAQYRSDVAELNGRARALMRADGLLGTD